LVLLVLVAGGAYYFRSLALNLKKEGSSDRNNVVQVTPTPTQVVSVQPSPSPIATAISTVNWKTISNQYGYSIKYPPSLKIVVGPNPGNEDETNSGDVEIYSDQGGLRNSFAAVHINVFPKSVPIIKGMTLAQISEANYEANLANKNSLVQSVIPPKLTTLDNKPAYTYTMIANGYSGVFEGWMASSSTNYKEKLTVVESENKETYFIVVYSADDPTMPLVFSTFKFTQ
jgi:hypothetical protein